MNTVIKLSSASPRTFWEIPVLFEDAHLLVLDKPSGLRLSPDREHPDAPALMPLLHGAIAAGKPWVAERGLTYLCQAHRLDAETSGVLILAKSKAGLIALANQFGNEKPFQHCLILAHGAPLEERFEVGAKIAPHPLTPGKWHVDAKRGKKARTIFTVRERFAHCTLLQGEPATSRPHQLRVHLQNIGWPPVGDGLYGGNPLLLSRLKPGFRLKPGRTERPLLEHALIHVEAVQFLHPVTGAALHITAPEPKGLSVALKYLRLYGK